MCHQKYICYLLFLSLICFGCEQRRGNKSDLPKLTFRLSNELKPDSKIWDASRLFKEELEKEAPELGIQTGEIQVVFFDQGTVGSERQLLETCHMGVIEAVQINSSVVTTIDPAYNILDLPYLFLTESHHEEVLNGPIGDAFLKRLTSHNLRGLAFYGTGFRNMFYKATTGNDCADTPEGLDGLKIRVMESPTMINAINAMGASATPIPFGELYQALKTGVVDGAENSARVFVSYRYDEAGCNCFTLTEHFANQHMIIVNDKWFSGLDQKYQTRLNQAAKISVKAFDELWKETTSEAIQKMESLGVTVNRITSKKEFRDRVEDQYERFLNDHPEVPVQLFEQINQAGLKYSQ